jgi:hypothetical protein
LDVPVVVNPLGGVKVEAVVSTAALTIPKELASIVYNGVASTVNGVPVSNAVLSIPVPCPLLIIIPN